MLSICSVSYTWPMYLSDGKLNRKIIALCSVFVRIDHIYIYKYDIINRTTYSCILGLIYSFSQGQMITVLV